MNARIIVVAGAFLFAAQSLSTAAPAGPKPNTAPPAATSAQPRNTFPQLADGVKSIVKLCFTVKADGSVTDARVKKIEFFLKNKSLQPKNSVKRAVEKAALDGTKKWKFYPRRINGMAVATSNVCQIMNFNSRNPPLDNNLAAHSVSAAAPLSSGTSAADAAATGSKANVAPPQLRGGVQSNVKVCFTVDADGSVTDARVKRIAFILKNNAPRPGKRVQRALIKTALLMVTQVQWISFPRQLNGVAVATPNVCRVMEFKPNKPPLEN